MSENCDISLKGDVSTLIGDYLKTLLGSREAMSKFEQLIEKAKVHFSDRLLQCFDEKAIIPFLEVAPESVTNETIQSIALMLENSVFGRERVWENRLAVYERLLQVVDDSISNLHIRSKALLLHHTLRVVLKFEQYYFSNWTSERLDTTNSAELSIHIWHSLMNVVENSICPTECCLLAGTSLGFFLHSSWNPVTGSRIFISAIVERGVDDSNLAHVLEQINLEAECQLLPGSRTSNSALYLLNGLLSCGKYEILLAIDPKWEDFVIFKLFPIIIDLCKDSKQNLYHAFNVLLSWVKFVHKHLKRLFSNQKDTRCTESWFGGDSVFVNSILSILNVNWTCSVIGVTDILKEIYTLLIDIHVSEEKLCGLKGTLVERLFNQTMEQPWTLKQRYPPLAILMRYVNFEKIISLYPSFIMDLSESLASNSLAAVGCEVFTGALRQLNQSHDNFQDRAIEKWKSNFLEPLFQALSHQNSVIQQNAVRYWLLAIMKFFPQGIEQLQCSLANREMNSKNLMVAILLMRMARNHKGYLLDFKDTTLLRRCLSHAEDNLRTDAFAVLCCHHKRAEPLSSLEIDLIKEYLWFNFNIDSAPFRHQLACNFKVLLGRLRDSSLSYFALLKKNKIDNDSKLTKSMEFMYWLVDCVMINLSPGGCYQRRQTSLMLLKTIFDVFLCSPNSRKKSLVPESFRKAKTAELLRYFEACCGHPLFSTRLRYILLSCILDYMTEIKEMAFTLLTYHPVCCCPLLYDNELAFWVLELCNSPKTAFSESGAFLFQLCFYTADFNQKLCMIENLKTALSQQLALAKTDFFLASKAAPMHGLTLALSRALCYSGEFWKNEPTLSQMYTLICDCASVACDIIFHVLSILAAKSSLEDVEASPSFADMGNAIEDIITVATSTERKQTTISLEHQLILACCWLSLKECSLFLGKLVDVFCIQAVDSRKRDYIDFDTIKRISDAFMSILLKCRHRGVIESCNLGFELFCQKLSRMSDHNLSMILSELHSKALNNITSVAIITSVTRRSAGLPALFQAILKGENMIQKRRLCDTLQNLLQITQQPLTVSFSDVIDLPQAQALHILQAVIHDAGFSQQILEFMNDIVRITFSCFHSPSWAIRNAALQAYGSLIPRLLGQKNVSNDSSQHNKIDCNGFFEKWEQLHKFFMAELENADNVNPKMTVLLVLNLLGRFIVLDSGNHKYSEDFLLLVKPFTSCPSWNVRRMAAKAIVGLHKPEAYIKLIEELSGDILRGGVGLNQIHGWLLILKELVEKANHQPNSKVDHAYLRGIESCMQLIKNCKHCPVIQSAAFDVLLTAPCNHFDNFNALRLIEGLQHEEFCYKPGYWQLVRAISYWHLQGLSQNDALSYMSMIIGSKEASNEQLKVCLEYLQTLTYKSEKCLPRDCSFWINAQNLLVIFLENTRSSDLLEQCLEQIMSIYAMMSASPDTSHIRRMLKACVHLSAGGCGSSVAAFCIPVWAIGIQRNADMIPECLLWTKFILQHSSPEFSEIFRLSAARALMFCGKKLLENIMPFEDNSLHPDSYVYVTRILDATVRLLQDEQVDVRRAVTNFVASLNEHPVVDEIHTNLAIKMLSSYIAKYFWRMNELIMFFWEKFECRPQLEMLINEKTLPTPAPCASLFEQDDINVFAEKPFISRFYVTTLKALLQKNAFGITWLISHLGSVMTLAEMTITWLKTLERKEVGCLKTVTEVKVATLLCNLCNELEIVELVPATADTAFHLRQTLNSIIGFTWCSQGNERVDCISELYTAAVAQGRHGIKFVWVCIYLGLVLFKLGKSSACSVSGDWHYAGPL